MHESVLYLQGLEPILEIIKPGVAAFVVERFERGLVWKLRNDSNETINRVRAQVLKLESFSASKGVFRPPDSVRVGWAIAPELKADYDATAGILAATDGQTITVGQGARDYLPWPNTDQSIERRWLVKLKIAWDFGEWQVDLDIRWRVGTQQIEVAQYRSVPDVDSSGPSTQETVATEPGAQNEKARKKSPPPRRMPDLETSRRRIAFFDSIATELATVKQSLIGYCTTQSLKRKHPRFEIWKLLSDSEIKEIAEGAPFTPKSYAEHLTLRKFGITSRNTLKKDRQKLKRAGNH